MPIRIQRRRTKGWRDTSEHAEAKRTRHLHQDTAIRLAQEQAPLVSVNGLTAAEALRRWLKEATA